MLFIDDNLGWGSPPKLPYICIDFGSYRNLVEWLIYQRKQNWESERDTLRLDLCFKKQ